MKKLLITIISCAAILSSAFAQEKLSSSDQKIWVGLSGVANYASYMHYGLKATGEYFLADNISAGAAYSFAYKNIERGYDESARSLGRSDRNVRTAGADISANTYIHSIELLGQYYFMKGDGLDVFAGVAPAFNIIRSAMPDKDYNFNRWYGIYLGILAGANYDLGPGKVFATLSTSQRVLDFKKFESRYFFQNFTQLNIGYKIGF